MLHLPDTGYTGNAHSLEVEARTQFALGIVASGFFGPRYGKTLPPRLDGSTDCWAPLRIASHHCSAEKPRRRWRERQGRKQHRRGRGFALVDRQSCSTSTRVSVLGHSRPKKPRGGQYDPLSSRGTLWCELCARRAPFGFSQCRKQTRTHCTDKTPANASCNAYRWFLASRQNQNPLGSQGTVESWPMLDELGHVGFFIVAKPIQNCAVCSAPA